MCGIYKNDTDERICKAETETQMERKNVWTPKGKGMGGMNWEIVVDMYTLLCIK